MVYSSVIYMYVKILNSYQPVETDTNDFQGHLIGLEIEYRNNKGMTSRVIDVLRDVCVGKR
jgi:hypothetical protein